MNILPIVERELRVSARKRGTYLTRSGVALIAILVGTVLLLASLGEPPARRGAGIFIYLAGLAMLHCLLAGRVSTADCLTEEKREGTLGLLFLTDLKGYDVIFGKLAATSLKSFYGLLALFPVLAVPLMLGGVTNGQFWCVVLMLVNTFLFSLAVGVFCSAFCREVRKAMGLNIVLMLLFCGILPGCAVLLSYNRPAHVFPLVLCFTSPLFGLWTCIAQIAGFPGASAAKIPLVFWESLAVIHSLTWLFLFWAARIVPHSWQDRPSPPVRPDRMPVREIGRIWNYGDRSKRVTFRRRLLNVNAFYWLAARARLKPLHVWAVFGLFGVWWVCGRLATGLDWLEEPTNVALALMLNSTLKLWVAIEAGQRLAEDKKIGALELVLSTPLTVRDILRGQLLALRRQFLAPLLAAIVLEFILMQASKTHAAADRATSSIWLAGILMLPVDLAALVWVSIARALVAKNANIASAETILRILVLPWICYGLVMVTGQFLHEYLLQVAWEPGWKFGLAWWLGLGLAADAIFGLQAYRQVFNDMRKLAAAVRKVN